MIAFRVEELDIKIRHAEHKYEKAQKNSADRSLLNFLKKDIEYLRDMKRQLDPKN